MKAIVSLFVCCVLFTSYHSYKTFNGIPSEVRPGEKYHFDFKNGQELTKRVDSLGTDVYYITRVGEVHTIAFSEVRKLEEGTFSTGKTIGLSGLIALGATAITAFIIFVSNY